MSLIEKLKIELLSPVDLELVRAKYGESVIEQLHKSNNGFIFIGDSKVQSAVGQELASLKDYYAMIGVKPDNDSELKYMIKRLSDYERRNPEIAEALSVLNDERQRKSYNEKIKNLQSYFLKQVKLDSFRFLALGGAGEVGRSSYYVRVGKNNYFLLDLGISPSTEFPPFYELLNFLPKVKAVFISHAHFDHYGLISKLKVAGLKQYLGDPLPPIIASPETKVQIEISLNDLVNKGKLTNEEKDEIIQSIKEDRNGYGTIGSVSYKLIDSGHIRGSKMILLEADGDSLLYTGDINFEDNEVLRAAGPVSDKVDTLITEATYAGVKKKDDYEKRKNQLISYVNESLQSGFNVLIPAFSIYRTELVLRIMNDAVNSGKISPNGKILVSGLGAALAQIFGGDVLNNVDFSYLAREDGAKKIKDIFWKEKKKLLVTGSGELSRGLSSQILLDAIREKDVAIILVGYQPRGSLGEMILRGKDSGRIVIGDSTLKIACRVLKVDLGAHASEEHIFGFIEKVKPKSVIVIHSDNPEEFSDDLMKKYGIRSIVPKNLEIVFDYGAKGLSWMPMVEEGKQLFYCECGMVFTDRKKALAHFDETGHREVYPYKIYTFKILKAKGIPSEAVKQEVEKAKEMIKGALEANYRKVFGLYDAEDRISVVTDVPDENEVIEIAKELNKVFETMALAYFKRPNQVVYKGENYKLLFAQVLQEFTEKFGVQQFEAPLIDLFDPGSKNFKTDADAFFKPEKSKIFISQTMTGHEMLLREIMAHELAHYYQKEFSKEDFERMAELIRKKDQSYMQWAEGFAEFVPYYLKYQSEYRPIINEIHKERYYVLGLEKYRAIFNVFGLKGVMQAALSLEAFKDMSERAKERAAYNRSSERALLLLKKAGVYKKILLKRGFDPVCFYKAWKIDRDYISLKKVREKKKYFSLSSVKKEMISKALAYALLSSSKVKDLSEKDEVLEMVSDLVRNRLNLLYIFRKKPVFKSMEINEYVYGLDVGSTRELLEKIKEGKRLKYSVEDDGKIHYKLAEDTLGFGRAFAKYYLDKMEEASVIKKNYGGMIVGCRLHKRFDALVRLVCPRCGSFAIRAVDDGKYKCENCGSEFDKPGTDYVCKEGHAFDLDSSESSEVFEYSLTEEAKKRLER